MHQRVGRRVREVQHALRAADLQRFADEAERAHQRLAAEARDAVDHDQREVGLLGADELQVGVAGDALGHHQVGALACGQRAQHAFPLQQPGRLARHHRDEFARLEDRRRARLAPQVRDLQLVEQVAAARRRPVAAERDRHAGRLGRRDVGGAAVEQHVAEGRPDHAAALGGEDLEVARLQRRGMDAAQRWRDRPFVGRELQRFEGAPRGRVQAFRQVQQVAGLLLLQARQEGLRIVRRHVGHARGNGGQGVVVGGFDVADHAPEVAPDAGLVGQRDALARRGAADQRLGLDVAADRGQQLRRGGERLHRRRDLGVVFGMAAPLPAVAELLRHLPQRQHVVGQVVVQIDQAGKYRAAGVRHRRVAEARGRRRVRLLHRDDVAVLRVDAAAGDHLEGRVHRDDAALEHELRAVGRVEGFLARGHAHSSLPTGWMAMPRERSSRPRAAPDGADIDDGPEACAQLAMPFCSCSE